MARNKDSFDMESSDLLESKVPRNPVPQQHVNLKYFFALGFVFVVFGSIFYFGKQTNVLFENIMQDEPKSGVINVSVFYYLTLKSLT